MKNDDFIKLHFLGAARTVTGSKYLIETTSQKILVDCGLFQGLKELRTLNWNSLPIDASSIDCVVLTHGHLDHTGYLPLLVKQGFSGKIFATSPTLEITKLILTDSARIQEEDAQRANKYGYSKHIPAVPLYNLDEAQAVFPLLMVVSTSSWHEILPNVFIRLTKNGHIIGSVFIEIRIQDKTIVFSGDLGRNNDPLMAPPHKPQKADIVIMESTYGDRIHPSNPEKQLEEAINKAAQKNGTIIIPGFAVERSQLLMYMIYKLFIEKRIPHLPIYMDSPMGIHVLDLFEKFPDWHILNLNDCYKMCQLIHRIKSMQETIKVAQNKSPKIVIAASGMATGGRVLSYFERYLGDPSSTILLAGYQSEGTRGRAMLDGAKEIKLRGKYWPVRSEVLSVEGLSAHADQNGLINWLSELNTQNPRLFITHGENRSALALRQKIETQYGWKGHIPQLNEVVLI